ncbi:MAG: 30S ribosomal protein S16 [uncultured Bacteroidota bacterium]|nr:MAG: 30S ribosomal protein S16 [uncultured Bacteroidetes bacterium]
MPVKIRLQRHGKKGKPFYWIVAADARSKRDGRYLEKLGTYNPNTNPATVEVKLDNAVNWLEKGAQPTDTARTLLSYRGVMLKHHLNGGIRKGALSQEEADKKFAAWLEEKEAKIQAKKEGLSQSESELKAKRLADEKALSDKRLADAAAAEAEAAAEEATAESTEAEEATPEVAEAPAEQTEAVAEQTEAPAEEATTEKEAVAEEAEQEAKETEAAEEPEASAEQTEASEEKEE